MQPAQLTPLAELVKSLAGLHQAQHQALMDMKLEQEDRFRLLVQAQDEDRRAIRSLLGREETPVAAPLIAHVPLMKMGPHDDPEASVDLFEKTAEACGWACSQWPVCLIPLLTGGSTGSSPTVACRKPPGLRRPKAGHPSMRRPEPRAAPSTLPLHGTRGLRPTIRDGSAAPGHMPQVALVRATRCRGCDRPGGAGAVRRPTAPANGRVGPCGNGQSDRYPRRGGGPEPCTPPQYSLRQSLAYPSAAGAAVRPWPACWRCGNPGHFQDHCPMMEVGLLVRVPDSPGAAPDQAGQYQIPVSIKGGTYQALVDSGCNQTSIHQSLIQQRALDTGRKVKVRCVHGDVANYPLVPVSIKFRGKIHRMEVAVNSHLKHPLILGTDCPAFTQFLGDSVCGCLLADGAGPGGGGGSDRRSASGAGPACLGGNESQRGGENPGA